MKTFHSTVVLSAIALMLALCTVPSHAATIIGNMPATSSPDGTTVNSGLASGKAIGFTMGSESFDNITVTVRLQLDAMTDVPQVEIWTGDGTDLGAFYASMTTPSYSPSGYQNLTFTADPSVVLDASTQYYVVVRNSGTTNFLWIYGPTQPATPTGAYASSPESIYGTGSPTSWHNVSGVYNWIQVDGLVVVPEPSVTALLLAGGLCALVRMRNLRAAVRL